MRSKQVSFIKTTEIIGVSFKPIKQKQASRFCFFTYQQLDFYFQYDWHNMLSAP